MALKKSFFKQYVLPGIGIFVFTVGLIIAVEELVSSEGEYRVTIWDRLNGRSELPTGNANVSQQLAIQVCYQQALSQFKRNLLQSRFDNRSSRYNQELKVHTIFLDLTIKGKERDSIYIRCDISAVNRMILEYRIKGLSGFGFFTE